MNPVLFEVFARSWLAETGARTLAEIPDAELDRLAALGVDVVWVMGVWTLGTVGPALARREVFPDLPPTEVVGSPYAVARYAVAPAYGGNGALAVLRARLAARSIRLVLDFVPNHTARDHHWIIEAPDRYVHDGAGVAMGKDPYFPAWTDTAQLDLRLEVTRATLIETLLAIAAMCDGVRCDMAMLVLSDVFERTWQRFPPRSTRAPGEFWAAAIDAVRARHREFAFIAEAYWDLEPRLQRLGFDLTYDKTLYDRLLAADLAGLRTHLATDLEIQQRMLRFLENHDEPRLAHELPMPQRTAALVLAMTLPGTRMIHDGQLEGRTQHARIHLARRPTEAADPASIALHETLLALLRLPALRDGAFRTLRTSGSVFAHRWEHPAGSVVIAVNYSDREAHDRFPLELHGIEGRSVTLRDHMDGAEYVRDGTELVDPARGLHVVLRPWQVHAFSLVR